MKSVSKKDVAVNRMICDHPFFAHVLLQKQLREDPTIPTACVNAYGNMRYNPAWFDTLTTEEIIFVLAHEVMHYLCMHPLRRMGRDPFWWNYAGDGHINDILEKSGVGSMPEQGVRWENGADLTTEAIYAELDVPEQPPQPQGNGEGEGDDGDGEGQGDKPQPGDDNGNGKPMGGIGMDLDESEGMTEAEAKNVIEQIRLDVSQAETAAKQMGKMPGPLVEFAKQIVHVRTPWYKIMERFAQAFKPNDITFENLDRRFIEQGEYLPYDSGLGMDEVALIIDASGSTRRWWNYFGGHFNKILETVKPSKLHVIYTTMRVDHVEEYTPDEYPIEIGIRKTGGTHMPAGVEYVENNLPNVACMVVLTDGETGWGHESPIPVMWAITQQHITAPHGETVHIIMEDEA